MRSLRQIPPLVKAECYFLGGMGPRFRVRPSLNCLCVSAAVNAAASKGRVQISPDPVAAPLGLYPEGGLLEHIC